MLGPTNIQSIIDSISLPNIDSELESKQLSVKFGSNCRWSHLPTVHYSHICAKRYAHCSQPKSRFAFCFAFRRANKFSCHPSSHSVGPN